VPRQPGVAPEDCHPMRTNQGILDDFEIQRNALVANTDLYWENHAEFQEKCERLLASPHEEIILDLTDVSFVFSAYMGTIAQILAEAARANKKLTIRISPSLTWLFEVVGFEKMIHIDVVS